MLNILKVIILLYTFFQASGSVRFNSFYSNSQVQSPSLLALPSHSNPPLTPPLPAKGPSSPSPPLFQATPPPPAPSPVGAEGSESEHGNPHGGELNHRDQFAAHIPEHPLVKEVTRGIHWDAGEQQQQVPGGQIRDEDVGDAPHGAVGDKDLHQQDVAQQAHRDDEQVEARDHAADRELGAGPVGGWQEVSLRHSGDQVARIHLCALGEVAKRFGGHVLLSGRVHWSFHAPWCPDKCTTHLGLINFPLTGSSLLPGESKSHCHVPKRTGPW